MLDLALMIEGQNGLNWPRWQQMARAAENLGFAGLYRSDHFTNPEGPHLDSLELWASLTWLASNTTRIEFGPLVSPVSFRNPVVTAWTAAAVDDLSSGRLNLGLGAGWQEREHQSHGFDLLDVDHRFERFVEGIEVVKTLLESDTPSSFDGEFYHLDDALLLPRPERPGGPPIVIGGNGPKRTLPLAAKYAREWNAVSLTPVAFAERCAILDDLLAKEGRQPGDVRRTMMTRVVPGENDAAAEAKVDDAPGRRSRGQLIGSPDRIVEDLGKLAEAGVQRVMAQWLDLDDIDGIELLAAKVLPQLAS
ncbi:MAG: TIGR03560 family F420-dependent LLM class oxidoreductase [Rhizobiales bacterium]|nr:TIGR03560 family F420-dependent LLM class oxidoreductase [Hyphomicrobiales bacterium]